MQCTIEIKDEVNAKIHNLTLPTRRRLEKEFKYLMPHAYHVPAFKLGRWDGCVSFFSAGGLTNVALLEKIVPVLVNEGYEIGINDKRNTPVNFNFPAVTNDKYKHITWPKGHVAEGEDIILRDYQVSIINEFLTNPQCIQEIATGAGKTLITACLSEMVEPYGRSLVIVPNKSLVTQTEDDYKNLGLDVGVYFGDRKEIGKTHTICTWQSLNIIDKTFKDATSDMSLAEFAEDVICVMVDEVHMAKADVLRRLLTQSFNHIPIRWGLTGTVPKADWEKVSLEVSLGQVTNKLGAAELQEKGVLANCEVNVLQLADIVEFPTYQQELTFLTTDKKRVDYMAQFIETISKSGNTLVLVDRIKAGKMLTERLGDESTFISGSVKVQERRESYDEIQTADNKIIVATYGVASVGINIPRIFNLVLIEPGKSFVRVIQSIGRGIRRAGDKNFVQIWDITSTAKFSKRHLTTRKKFYKEAQYPFNIQKATY